MWIFRPSKYDRDQELFPIICVVGSLYQNSWTFKIIAKRNAMQIPGDILIKITLNINLRHADVLIKHRWCVWGLNLGRQDGRCSRIHWAMVVPLNCTGLKNSNWLKIFEQKSFIVKFVLYCHVKRTKINKKRPGYSKIRANLQRYR